MENAPGVLRNRQARKLDTEEVDSAPLLMQSNRNTQFRWIGTTGFFFNLTQFQLAKVEMWSRCDSTNDYVMAQIIMHINFCHCRITYSITYM
jgi:hypothetical protein